MKKVIAIDLGSNTLSIIQWDCMGSKLLYRNTYIVKTALGLSTTGVISLSAMQRIVNTVNELKKEIEFKNVIAITTEAIRQADNREEVLSYIEKNTNISFKIISANEEAMYTLLAVEKCLIKLESNMNKFVLVDIGGSSIEMIFKYGNKIFIKSFKIGVMTVLEKDTVENILKNGVSSFLVELKKFTKKIYDENGKIEFFVATAQTSINMAAMKLGMIYKNQNRNDINGMKLSKKDLDIQLSTLLKLSDEERIEVVGVKEENIIVSGIMIYKELYTIIGLSESIVICDGLCEGLVYQECKK